MKSCSVMNHIFAVFHLNLVVEMSELMYFSVNAQYIQIFKRFFSSQKSTFKDKIWRRTAVMSNRKNKKQWMEEISYILCIYVYVNNKHTSEEDKQQHKLFFFFFFFIYYIKYRQPSFILYKQPQLSLWG